MRIFKAERAASPPSSSGATTAEKATASSRFLHDFRKNCIDEATNLFPVLPDT